MERNHNMTDYAQCYKNFRLEVPEYYNFVVDVVDKWAEKEDKPALLCVDDFGNETRYTFGDLKEKSDRVGALLQRVGVNKGDRVFVMLPRIPQWWEIVLGILKAGAVAMPGTVQLTSKDVAYRIKISEAKVAVTDPENAPKIEEVKDQCPQLETLLIVGGKRPGWISYSDEMNKPYNFVPVKTKSSEEAILYFTSGTTGYPKMVLHTHASYPLAHLITGKYWLDLKTWDRHWNVSDNGWAKAAWSSLFGPWHMGAEVFVHNTKGRFNPKLFLELIEKYKITTLCAPPTAYRLFVFEDLSSYNFSSLRHCVSAGEPLNPEVISIWEKHTGLKIYDGYGQTETVVLVANFPCMEVKPGSMGKPVPGFKVDIIDENGVPVPGGEEGNIAVKVSHCRPVGMFKEYLKDPEGTESRFKNGWYLTGDRAYKDEDGYFWFVGRADDVIISAGYRIGPFEVESALIEHPAVVEAAVVGSPDPVRGEIVKAFIILAEGYEPSEELAKEIQEFVKSNTAPYKYPREIKFVERLPKTISGKIQRVKLREEERKRKLKARL
ncbi:MAG: AMP-binding protein [Clostridia bacterium]|nr:AMP-binding protein [Clostridia bacterium]